MKVIFKRAIAIFAIMLLILNNSVFIILSTAAEAIEESVKENKINGIYEINLDKYVNYKLQNKENETGTLLQYNLKTGIEYLEGEEYKTLNSTGILLKLPQIEDYYPERVEVQGISTKATNGSEEAKDWDFIYNKDNGEVKIGVLNKENENGEIYKQHENDLKDEFRIICYYGESAYADNKIRDLEISGILQLNVNDGENEIKRKIELNKTDKVTENISGLISIEVETSDIYNGYINSNNQNGTSKETKYVENIKIISSYKEISDEITIKVEDYLVNKEGEESKTSDVVYNSTIINKNEILNNLGQDGYLKIFNENGENLGEVNKDTKENEDGNIVFTYDDTASLTIKMSKNLSLSDINIYNKKEIKRELKDIENNQIKIKSNIMYEKVEEGNIDIIQIKDSETKIDLSIDNTKWTNNVQNHVNFIATLVTENETYNLFKNPVFEIQLPEEVERVILENVNLLYDDNLEILDAKIIERDNSKVIRVEISGTQDEYISNDLIRGAEIIIPATVILSKEIDKNNINIKYTYENESGIINDYIKEGQEAKEINIEVETNNILSDVIEPKEEEKSDANTEKQVENITMQVKTSVGNETLSEGNTVYEREYIKYEIKLKNNNDTKIENINVIGNVPDGTIYVKCYFGEISIPDNYDLWKVEEDKDKKEHKEVIDLEAGEEKEVVYYVRANYLNEGENEKEIETKISVQKDEQEITQSIIKNKIKKAEIEAQLRAWETERSDNLWIYEINVSNNTEKDINNVTVDMDLQDEIQFSYIEDYVTEYSVDKTAKGIRVNIPKLNAKSTQKINLFMQISGTDDNVINYEITTCAVVKGDKTNTYHSNINKQIAHMVGIEVIQTSEKEGMELQYDEEVEYNFVIKNVSDEDIMKSAISLELINYADKNLVPLTVDYEYYEYSKDTLKWEKKTGTKDISKKGVPEGTDENSIADLYLIIAIPKGKEVNLSMKFKAGEVYEKTEVSNCLKIVYDYLGAHTVTSNIIKNIVLSRFTDEDKEDKYYISGQAWLDINEDGKIDNSEKRLEGITVRLLDANSNGILKDEQGEDILKVTDGSGQYKFENLNKGNYKVIFEYDNKTYKLTTYKKDSVSEEYNSDVIEKQIEINNVQKTVAISDTLNIEDSNIKYINMGLIKKDDSGNGGDSGDGGDGDNEDKDEKYYINGTAWVDSNKDGKIDSNEEKLDGVTVKLFDSATNNIVKNEKGENLTKTTDKNGQYKFENLKEGKYLVLFEYDNNLYNLTTYKKESISEQYNSDVVKKQVMIDNIQKIVALTDILNLQNTNIENINMGLVLKENFDLSLNKSISKVIVKANNYYKEYEYDKLKLAKVEISAKKIEGAVIEVEYEVDIKNEGNVEGYVDEIVDYIPEGFEFDKTLNSGWVKSSNGVLKNTTYAGVIINSGETKTIKLYLTKTLDSKSVGIFVNNAEILKSTSVNGEEDLDSTYGNRIETEDDYSKAELIISVNTGIVLYTGIIALIVAILIILKILIDKKIINIKGIKMFSIVLVMGSVLFVFNNSTAGDANVATYTPFTFEDAKNYVYSHYIPSSTGAVNCYFTNVDEWADSKSDVTGYDWVTGPFDEREYDPIYKYEHVNFSGSITHDNSPGCGNPHCNHELVIVGYNKTEYLWHGHKAINYVHHGASSNVSGLSRENGDLYCTDGENMAGYAPGWSYSYSSLGNLIISSVEENDRSDVATAFDNGSNPSFKGCYDLDGDSNYYLVGPFSVSYSGTVYQVVVTARNQQNSQLYNVGDFSIVNSNNQGISISSGGQFYLRVPKSVNWIDSVTVKVNKIGNIRYKMSYSATEYWRTGAAGDAQVLGKDVKNGNYLTDYIPTLTYNEVTLSGTRMPIGNLQIQKVDYDTRTTLKGYKIVVSEPNYYFRKTIYVGSNSISDIYPFGTYNNNGVITITNLPSEATYTMTEVEAPDQYKLELQTDRVHSRYVPSYGTASILFTNRKYGNLTVEKVDNSKANDGLTGETLHTLYDNEPDKQLGDVELDPVVFKNIGFKVYYTIPGDSTKRYISNYVANEHRPSSYIETNETNAQIFKTDNNGQFKLINIPQYYIYHVQEVELTDDMAQYYDVGIKDEEIHLNNNYQNAITYYLAKNVQKRVDVAGYVWEDKQKTKTSKRDDLYTVVDNTSVTEDDKRIGGIMVCLKKNGKVIAKRRTNTTDIDKSHKVGEYFFPAKGDFEIDDNNPKTYDYTIDISELSQYSVEFEYNGLKYETVANNISMANGSKAKETNENRARVNANYHQIEGKTPKDSSGTQGITSNNVPLTYTSGDNYNSQLVQNTSYIPETLQGSTDVDSGKMYADTKTSGYTLSWSTGIRVIRNVNLGIYEREQPDLAIVTDIDNIKLSINGYDHTYKYQQRDSYISEGIPDKDINAGYNAAMDGFSVSVKNLNTGNYKTLSYKRDVYDSYISYTKNDTTNKDRLRMFVTYKIAIKNETSSLISRVSLKNYADVRYEKISNSYIYGSNTDITNQWRIAGTVNESGTNKNIWESEIIGQDIASEKCMYIYLTYEVSTDAIVDLAKLSPNGQSKLQLDTNSTEIAKYATWDSNGRVYAGIDKDSAPDNITYKDVNTYEDDTDSAPELCFTRKESKQFSGLVFEDGTKNSSQLNSGEERLGNGIYDKNEKTVENVEVKLVQYDNNLSTENTNVVKLYTLDEKGNVIVKNAQAITGKDGTYNFTGFVPGEYYIVYTYGEYTYVDMNKDNSRENKQTKIDEKEVTTQDYKSTIINEETYRTLIDNNYTEIKDKKLWYWYEKNENFNKSSAVDDEQIRNEINNYLSTITYGKKTDYERETFNGEHNVMKSYTGIIDVAVEDERYQQTNYDYVEGSRNYEFKFGIVERPRQSVEVTKEVDNIKIVLANGQIIIGGNKDEIRSGRTKYAVYPEGGPLKIEIDNEIIEGADLDINYKIMIENKSEADYDNVDYYRYGVGKNNKYKTNLVKIKLDAIVDYVDEKLSLTYDIDDSVNSNFVYYNPNSNIVKDKWQIISDNEHKYTKENLLAGVDISPNVYRHIKERNNIVVRNTDLVIEPPVNNDSKTTTEIELLAKKKLTSIVNSDNIFDNYVELVKISNSVGRFYGQMNNNTWELKTPGNFDVTTLENIKEIDTNSNSKNARVTIVPPTGKNTVFYYMIGISCLMILVAGIVIIKKKVL